MLKITSNGGRTVTDSAGKRLVTLSGGRGPQGSSTVAPIHATQHYPAGTDPVNAHPYHGLENRTASTFVWTDSTPDRTLTITGTFSYWYQGNKIVVNASPAVQITNTTGIWFFYFNSAGVLTASQNFPAWYTTVIVAIGWWNGTHGLICDERHGYLRNIPLHDLLHSTVGCRYGSGLDLTFVANGGSSTFAVASGNIWDEDNNFTVPISSAWTAAHAARIWKQIAATGTNAYTYIPTPSTAPFLWNSGTSRVQFVQSDHATPYSLVDCATNRYVNVFVYGANDINQPVWILVETKAGATGYTTATAARAVAIPNLAAMGLAPEMKILYRLVIAGDGTIQAAVAADDYRATSPIPAGGSAATTAAAVQYSPSTALPVTNVQAALDLVQARAVSAPLTATGNITGAVTASLLPDSTHTATLTGNITGWTITGLADGEGAEIQLANGSAYTVATTGLTAWPGAANALANVATDGIILVIQRVGTTYYAIC